MSAHLVVTRWGRRKKEKTVRGTIRGVLAFGLLVAVLAAGMAFSAPKADLWPRWLIHDRTSSIVVDHTSWDRFLEKYLAVNTPSGINLGRYRQVTEDDRKALTTYITSLARLKVGALNSNEQKAYWINLYNALTVKVVLDHYPVKSIRDIALSPGLFRSGQIGLLTVRSSCRAKVTIPS